MVAIESWLERADADAILVVGDVNSTVACALVGAKAGIPVGHVEAGLRSFDRRMPEEINRVVVDTLATWLFTPSADADENLLAEGVEPERIHLVGNVMVDSLHYALPSIRQRSTLDDLRGDARGVRVGHVAPTGARRQSGTAHRRGEHARLRWASTSRSCFRCTRGHGRCSNAATSISIPAR